MTTATPVEAWAPPAVVFAGERWSSARLARIGREWIDKLPPAIRDRRAPIAMVMANSPDDVALFFALVSLAAPVALLPPDHRSWPGLPTFPSGTPIVLAPSRGQLAGDAAAAGLDVVRLPLAASGVAEDGATRLASIAGWPLHADERAQNRAAFPGVIAFTSGSTGAPKPVYRRRASLLMEARAIAAALGLRAGDGVLASLPLAGIHGLVNGPVLATALGSELGLQERFEPRGAVALFETGAYRYWACTPFMADLMNRVPLSRPAPPAPVVCKISGGRLPEPVFRGFADRFGVRVRPAYGTTENGIITADMAAPAAIRPGAVGRPVPGVQLTIGEHPRSPAPPGVFGRVWFTSPWYMDGYGFPPDLEPRVDHGGWWPTQDTGMLDHEGYLTLGGRLDDGFKTAAGHLVNPVEVAAVLMSHPGVVDAVVTPVPSSGGAAIGALVEAPEGVDSRELQSYARPLLPPWARPHVLVVTAQLPRLVTGKIDQAACLELLERGRGA